MARPSTNDPLDKFRFSVQINGFTRAGFTQVESPGISLSTTEYHEGGNHLNPRQLVDKASYKPVTLQRGVTDNADFLTWIMTVYNRISGGANTSALGSNPNDNINNRWQSTAPFGKNVIINHLDRGGRIVKTYTLLNAFPVEFQPASDFASDGDDAFSIEKLVLKYEGIQVNINTSNGILSALNVTDIAKTLTRNLI